MTAVSRLKRFRKDLESLTPAEENELMRLRHLSNEGRDLANIELPVLLVAVALALLLAAGKVLSDVFDEEMDRIHRIVRDFVQTGSSEDKQYRAKGSQVPLF